MTTGIKSKGVDLDSIFDPYVQGTSPAATGVKFGGTDINTRYAPLIYGSSAAATGITCKPGGAGSLVDLNTLFAAKGTASYSLAINGSSYTEDSLTRGTVSCQFNILSNGTYNVTDFNVSKTPQTQVKATGTWLPAGDSASNWSVQIYNSGTGSVVASGDFTGVNTQTTTAASAQPLTSSQNALQKSEANTTGTRATWNGTITIRLFRLGVLRSTTSIDTHLDIFGN